MTTVPWTTGEVGSRRAPIALSILLLRHSPPRQRRQKSAGVSIWFERPNLTAAAEGGNEPLVSHAAAVASLARVGFIPRAQSMGDAAAVD